MDWRQNMVKAVPLLLAVSSPVCAQSVEPWTEAVVSVTDIAASSRLFREAGGWRVAQKGKVARAELNYWNMPDEAKATFERLCAPGTTTGCIRFVRFSGVPQRPIRLATRAWDTGGIFSIMIRSDNVPDLFDDAIQMGWSAESPPVRFQFGSSDLRNVVLTGPHGMNVAAYQRISPAFTAFPVGRMSQAFNSMRMVRNKPAAREFYERKLGFSVLFDSNNEPAEPTPSNFGIPLNYTPQIKRAAAALQPSPGETGRVEVMQIEGFTGADVQDLAAYRATIEARGVAISYEAEAVAISGIGTAKLVAVRDPDGNITEFYQRIPKGK
jgi:catechol 2,3-dioxygenase-like lactoylglutathione lyase family enzyme